MDEQIVPLLKKQEDEINKQIPSSLSFAKPKDSPSKLFQNYVVTGNEQFKNMAGKALNKLAIFATNAIELGTKMSKSDITSYTAPNKEK